MASRRSLTLRKDSAHDTETALEKFVLTDNYLNKQGEPAWSASPTYDIELDKILLPEFQLRLYYDREVIEQIKATILTVGIREPLLLRPAPSKGGYFELIAGSQRRLAAEELELKFIPGKVDDVDDFTALKIAFVENEARSDINPFERTRGIIQLLSSGLEISTDEMVQILTSLFNAENRHSDNNVIIGDEEKDFILSVFKEMGLNWKSFVANKLQLIKLPDDVISELEAGNLSYTKAIRIARIKDSNIRRKLLEKVVESDLTVKEIQGLINTQSLTKEISDGVILRDRARSVLRKATSSKLLKDKKIRKKVESLTNQLETLIADYESCV